MISLIRTWPNAHFLLAHGYYFSEALDPISLYVQLSVH